MTLYGVDINQLGPKGKKSIEYVCVTAWLFYSV